MNDGAEAAVERRPGKSAMAFRTISEVAGELDVPAHVLRFWESKFAQVRPLKRGGGRRYYRPEDVDLLRSIRELLYTEGYTIRGVQKLLREGGAKAVNAQAQAESVVRPLALHAAAPAAPAPEEAAGDARRIRAELREILSELENLRDLLRRSI